MADVKPLEEMTVAELKEELMGMGQGAIAETLQTRAQLLSVIAGLKASPANPEKVEIPTPESAPEPVTPEPKEEVKQEAATLESMVPTAPGQDRKDAHAYRSKVQLIKDKLDAQPKVQVFLPLEGKQVEGNVREVMDNGKTKLEMTGSIETVTINGYPTFIPRGKPVMVPQQVAELLGQSQVETARAGKDLEIDREDNRPNAAFKNVSEALG